MHSLAQQTGLERISSNLFSLQVGAKAFHRVLMEFLPYVETFESEAYRAKPLLRGLDDSQEWAVKQLLAQLEELHAQISQMKLKMTGMTGEVKKILTDNNAENKSSIPVTPMFKAENTGEMLKLKICCCCKIADITNFFLFFNASIKICYFFFFNGQKRHWSFLRTFETWTFVF